MSQDKIQDKMKFLGNNKSGPRNFTFCNFLQYGTLSSWPLSGLTIGGSIRIILLISKKKKDKYLL